MLDAGSACSQLESSRCICALYAIVASVSSVDNVHHHLVPPSAHVVSSSAYSPFECARCICAFYAGSDSVSTLCRCVARSGAADCAV
jgi:hypothetical protein